MLKTMKTGGYTVRFTSYSGMTTVYGEGLTQEEAKTVIRRRLRLARFFGNNVNKTAPGHWEIETRDDATAVSDSEGFLVVAPTTKLYRTVFGRRVIVS